MEVFDTIPFVFDRDKFYKKINIDKYIALKDDVDSLLSEVICLIRPKAVYKVSYVQKKTQDTVDIGEAVFKSRVMVQNLENVHRIFPYIATCGDELEKIEKQQDDILKRFWLDVLKSMALKEAISFLIKHIKHKYAIKKLASMNPGSADRHIWPIEQQKDLFSIFGDVPAKIGVHLTDSCLMLPNKSVSGFYFAAEVDYINCQLCTRENCPDRKAAYKG